MPNWVYDLVSAVEEYEELHGGHTEGWGCMGRALAAVPLEQRQTAEAIADYVRQADAEKQPS